MMMKLLNEENIVFHDTFDHEDDQYTDFEERFDPLKSDRQARRKRKPKAKHEPKKTQTIQRDEIADLQGLEGGFRTTYTPGLFEGGWLLDSLRQFYDQNLITDVLARVRGGKEANVYRCAAHPQTGQTLLAAKVYRPRMFRQIRDDGLYREGRAVLDGGGREVRARDWRLRKALESRSDLGVQAAQTSWLMYEYTALTTLHKAGAAVPQPFAISPNALLIGYIGDDAAAAPALSDVALDASEARPLRDATLHTIEIMLAHDMIHGDLSPYNILYWDGAITVIDFPQVVALRGNRQAEALLRRDITRVCEYFSAHGAPCDAGREFTRLWKRYNPYTRREIEAEMSRYDVEDDDDD
jgi:RIO kinase 1